MKDESGGRRPDPGEEPKSRKGRALPARLWTARQPRWLRRAVREGRKAQRFSRRQVRPSAGVSPTIDLLILSNFPGSFLHFLTHRVARTKVFKSLPPRPVKGLRLLPGGQDSRLRI